MEHLSTETPIITSLSDWLDTPLGDYVKTWEQERLDALTADIFGFNALQIGLPQIDALRANRMQHRWRSDMRPRLARQVPSGYSQPDGCQISLAHDFCDLPFASDSLDLVVLPHVLEFAAEPHQILREVARVLIPEGQLIICGFNPASLWGLKRFASQLTGTHFLPPGGEFIGLRRLKDWLKLLSMEINRGHFGCYIPPRMSPGAIRRYAFMEKAGNRWWPSLGGVYILQAVKRVRGMTMVGLAKTTKKPQVINIPVASKNTQEKHGQG
ncbi:MAG: class I SAM-dependent methyltransferase [Burkholderiaceae bacterium]|nr:class I SAM-dependent methyltransferase [Burkholderiaceae bacterium]